MSVETYKTIRFKNTHTQRYGGYVAYWKLCAKLWKMPFDENLEIKGVTEHLRFAKFCLVLHLLLKSPWWLFIKPLGCMFSVRTKSEGSVTTDSSNILKFNGEKFIVYKFLGMPFFARISHKFSDKEKRERAGLKV
ncbi:MAG: hypothetical protein WC119_04590 [Synergistaceae bacterium]